MFTSLIALVLLRIPLTFLGLIKSFLNRSFCLMAVHYNPSAEWEFTVTLLMQWQWENRVDKSQLWNTHLTLILPFQFNFTFFKKFIFVANFHMPWRVTLPWVLFAGRDLCTIAIFKILQKMKNFAAWFFMTWLKCTMFINDLINSIQPAFIQHFSTSRCWRWIAMATIGSATQTKEPDAS